MDNLFCLIVPIFFTIVAILNALAKSKQAQMMRQARGQAAPPGEAEEEEERYKAAPEDIARYLRSIATGEPIEPSQPTNMPPAAPGAPKVAIGVRSSGGTGPMGQIWPPRETPRTAPPPAPRRPVVEEGESTTRRIVPEAEHLRPTIEGHLRQRHLEGSQHAIEPTVEDHLRQRRLDETQHSLEPTIEEHLRVGHLEDAGTATTAQRATVKGGAAGTGRTQDAKRKGVALPQLSQSNLKAAFVMSELLQPPLALRGPSQALWAPQEPHAPKA
jgi:hypothetical protein